MLLGEAAMDRLRAAHVIVFGLGGVGSWCAEALARSGVGKLTLVDEDAVSESNINRQLCALGSTIGASKAEAMAARLRDIAPGAAIVPVTARYEAEPGPLLPRGLRLRGGLHRPRLLQNRPHRGCAGQRHAHSLRPRHGQQAGRGAAGDSRPRRDADVYKRQA